jgi:hypothetical protein
LDRRGNISDTQPTAAASNRVNQLIDKGTTNHDHFRFGIQLDRFDGQAKSNRGAATERHAVCGGHGEQETINPDLL